MGLKDKAARIDFSGIGIKPVETRAIAPKTAIGMHAEALFRDEKLLSENVELRAKLDEFADALPTRRIDAAKIHPSKWANRHNHTFEGEEFAQLRREIESAGGNVQPVKVRMIVGKVGEFELVFGHRRHRACLELGLPVLAVVDDVSDAELFCQMDRENRERAPLRPFEAGVMYARALDDGLFPSARKLAEAASIDLSQLGKALALARLPQEVIGAFQSPLDLQYRWASDLTAALQRNPDYVMAKARELTNSSVKPKSSATLKLLTATGGGTVPPPVVKTEFSGGGGTATMHFNSKMGTVDVTLTKMDSQKLELLKQFVQGLLK